MRWLSLLLLCSFAAAQKAASPWLFVVHTSPMDDSKSYILRTSSLKASSDAAAEFIIRCRDGNLEALISTDEPVDWDEGVEIRTRLDDFDPADETWDRVEGDRGFIIGGYDAEQFVKDVAGSRRLKIEYKTLLKTHRYVVMFNISGLKNRLAQLHGCTDKPKPPAYHPKVGIRCSDSVTTDCYDEQNVFRAH